MKKRMIIVTALIMGTLGAGCVSVQASDTLPELTKDNALEQMMKAGETDSLVSNHKSYEATCEYILQNTKVYDHSFCMNRIIIHQFIHICPCFQNFLFLD
mgnify:CR=1 FL=1